MNEAKRLRQIAEAARGEHKNKAKGFALAIWEKVRPMFAANAAQGLMYYRLSCSRYPLIKDDAVKEHLYSLARFEGFDMEDTSLVDSDLIIKW